jgi:sugar phosphate isomerase/epimerase
MMRIGCCAYSYRQYLQKGSMKLEDFISLCHVLGLDGVELTAYYFESEDHSYLKSLKRHAFANGMHISGTAIGTNFCQPDQGEREKQVEMAKRWIDISVVLGAPVMRVFAGGVPKGHTEEEAFSWAMECIRECVEYGEEKGVVVALENHGGITSTAEQVEKFFSSLKSPYFGLNLDFGNFGRGYQDIEKVAKYAVTAHAKTHYRSPSGSVELDYERIFGIMDSVGYRGYMNIEYEEAEDPKTAVPRFAKKLLEIRGRH